MHRVEDEGFVERRRDERAGEVQVIKLRNRDSLGLRSEGIDENEHVYQC